MLIIIILIALAAGLAYMAPSLQAIANIAVVSLCCFPLLLSSIPSRALHQGHPGTKIKFACSDAVHHLSQIDSLVIDIDAGAPGSATSPTSISSICLGDLVLDASSATFREYKESAQLQTLMLSLLVSGDRTSVNFVPDILGAQQVMTHTMWSGLCELWAGALVQEMEGRREEAVKRTLFMTPKPRPGEDLSQPRNERRAAILRGPLESVMDQCKFINVTEHPGAPMCRVEMTEEIKSALRVKLARALKPGQRVVALGVCEQRPVDVLIDIPTRQVKCPVCDDLRAKGLPDKVPGDAEDGECSCKEKVVTKVREWRSLGGSHGDVVVVVVVVGEA